jgi:hypothetical protein
VGADYGGAWYYPSMWEAEAGSLWAGGQPGLNSKTLSPKQINKQTQKTNKKKEKKPKINQWEWREGGWLLSNQKYICRSFKVF